MAILAAFTRIDAADYVAALFEVYIGLLLLYVLATLLFGFGLRPPYSRTLDAVMNFLGEVCQPYLRLFRRFIPQLGALDLSPMVALIVLYVLDSVIVRLIEG